MPKKAVFLNLAKELVLLKGMASDTLFRPAQTAGGAAQYLVWGSGAGLAWVANNSPKLRTD